MATWRIDWDDFEDFEDDLDAVVRDLNGDNRAALETAEAVAAVARGRAPKKSGRLASTVRAGSQGTKAVVEAGAGLEYGAVQEYGWPGHNIEPHNYVWGAIAQEKPEKGMWDGITKLMRRAFPGLTSP